jgi:SIR2-like domain
VPVAVLFRRVNATLGVDAARIGVTMDISTRDALLALLRERRMLLFVGAGLSFELGYPLWNGYLDALQKELGADVPHTDDLLERAERIKQAFAEAKRRDDYLAHIQQTFGPTKQLPYTQLQLALVRLGFRGVITTNFDPSLENALSAQNLAASRSACTALDLGEPRPFGIFDFLRSAGHGPTTEFVLHLHGVHDHPERIVLAASDYRERYGDFVTEDPDGRPVHRTLDVMLRKVIWTLLVTYPTLFVGFSLNDPALKHILRVVSTDFQRGRFLGHFAITGADSDEEERKRTLEWNEYGITPVFFRIVRSHGSGPDDYSNLTTLVTNFGADLGVDLGLDPIGAFTGRMLEL